MTITRQQIADLRVGDVVEVQDGAYTVRGPVSKIVEGDHFQLGMLAYAPGVSEDWTLTVIERAPRPLYVNHDRTEPMAGDVVRDADNEFHTVWAFTPPPRDGRLHPEWLNVNTGWQGEKPPPERLRLLVDGETGQVVP